jgi:hypothetical protein
MRKRIIISSPGDYAAEHLWSAEAEVRLSSSSSVIIWVRDCLRACLSSSGDVHYIGSPWVDATTTSSGDVVKVGE